MMLIYGCGVMNLIFFGSILKCTKTESNKISKKMN